MHINNKLTFKHIVLGTDKSWFQKMDNRKGTNQNNAIDAKAVISATSGVLSPQAVEFAVDAQRALDKQKAILATCNSDMNKKKPANVSPGDEERRKKLKTFLDSKPNDHGRRKTITVTTKCITDADGHTTTVKTTEEINRPTVTAAQLRQSQSTLSVYGFSGKDAKSANVIPIYQAKVVKKPDQDAKEKGLKTTLAGLDYVMVQDDPLTQEVNKLVRESDVIFLNIKEVKENDPEPRYFILDGAEAKPGIGQEDDTIDLNCTDCYDDACCEYLWGPYCVAAVERYFRENTYICNERDAYVVFLAHLNRRMDAHSYEESGASESLRPTQITKPPACMKRCSLKHCIKWIKWQRSNGPHSDWYRTKCHRRQRTRQTAEAKE